MAEAKFELDTLSKGVCLIKVSIPIHDGENRDDYKDVGTGFHWGFGWVMTNAHCLEYGPEYAEFIFPKDQAGQESDDESTANPKDKKKQEFIRLKFDANKRIALRFKLHSEGDDTSDPKDIDFALVKLGHQFPHTSTCTTVKWENTEESIIRPTDMPPFVNLVTNYRQNYMTEGEEGDKWDEIKLLKDKVVCGIYAKLDEKDEKCVTILKEAKVKKEVTLYSEKPTIIITPVDGVDGTFPEGASGCPVVVRDDQDNWQFLGMLFSGNKMKDNVLSFSTGMIQKACLQFSRIVGMFDRTEVCKRLQENMANNSQDSKEFEDRLNCEVEKCLNIMSSVPAFLHNDIYMYHDGKKMWLQERSPPIIVQPFHIMVYDPVEEKLRRIDFDKEGLRINDIGEQVPEANELKYYDGSDNVGTLVNHNNGQYTKPDDGWEKEGRRYVITKKEHS